MSPASLGQSDSALRIWCCRHMSLPERVGAKFSGLVLKTLPQAAATTVYAAISPDLLNQSGKPFRCDCCFIVHAIITAAPFLPLPPSRHPPARTFPSFFACPVLHLLCLPPARQLCLLSEPPAPTLPAWLGLCLSFHSASAPSSHTIIGKQGYSLYGKV